MKDTKFLANFFGGKASEWWFHLITDPERETPLTWDEAEREFMAYFDPYYGNDDLVAHQSLLAHEIVQTSTVRHYAQAFLTEVRIARGLKLETQLILFRFGLTPAIEARCRTHPTTHGGRFTSFEELVSHAAHVISKIRISTTSHMV